MSLPNLRQEVLRLYKRVLRLGKSWISKDPHTLQIERSYIQNEAKSLFRKNMSMTDDLMIRKAILEANSRIDIALHYQNPYPRPVNVPPKTLASTSRTYPTSKISGQRSSKLS